MRRKVEFVYRKLQGVPRYFALALAGLVLAVAVFSFVAAQDIVTVVDSNGRRTTLFTDCQEPERIVQLAGLSTSANDQIRYTANSDSTAEVYIQRAFPVTLMVDDEAVTLKMAEGTVQDVLDECGVQLNGDDFVQPSAATPLSEDMVVRVRRVEYCDEVRREQPTEEELQAYMESLPEDSGFVQSHNATYDITYRDRMVDGVVVESGILQMVPLVAPRPQDSYTITEGVPCSRIEGYDDVEMGIDGLPVNYTSLMEGAICTAYSSSGGKGASGLGLYCGTVAVNPNVIPYGTRMYITSADGKFVYGFAIATDTGTAMMEGRVDIDLYFETNAECRQFGKRALNVYILD